MMNTAFMDWASDSIVGTTMRDVFWLWPFMENLHFLGLSVLFGVLLTIDLRVLGVARSIPMSGALKLIPLAIMAFSVNLITGLAFYAGNPYGYTNNLAFQWKMGLILLAGVNALWFWFGEHSRLSKLGIGEQADYSAKLIAAISLAIWVGVIVLGRLIPYLE